MDWISVKDKLPDDFEEVLFFYVLSKHKKDIVCGHIEKRQWHICYLYVSVPLTDVVIVTHWMPLPEYPK